MWIMKGHILTTTPTSEVALRSSWVFRAGILLLSLISKNILHHLNIPNRKDEKNEDILFFFSSLPETAAK
jgi:hypothetical protein